MIKFLYWKFFILRPKKFFSVSKPQIYVGRQGYIYFLHITATLYGNIGAVILLSCKNYNIELCRHKKYDLFLSLVYFILKTFGLLNLLEVFFYILFQKYPYVQQYVTVLISSNLKESYYTSGCLYRLYFVSIQSPKFDILLARVYKQIKIIVYQQELD